MAYPGLLLRITSNITSPARKCFGRGCLPRTQKREGMCIQSSLQTRMCGIKAGANMEGACRVRVPGALWPRVRDTTANSEESPGFLKKRQLSQTPSNCYWGGTITRSAVHSQVRLLI